ncbi:MAG: hypothetical protein WCB76_09435, partial [Acidobacteriaceae bacterium]
REGVAGGGEVIDFDGEDTVFAAVSGDGNDGDGGNFGQRRIDGDDAFDGAGLKETRVVVKEIGAVAMADDEVEKLLFEERVFDSAEDRGRVAFADFGNHDADGEAALLAQAAGEGVGMVVEGGGGFADALLRGGRDAVLGAGVVEDTRDRGEREAEVSGEFLQADVAAAVRSCDPGGFRLSLCAFAPDA